MPSPSDLAPFNRVVADSSDRFAWLRARSRGITATDVAKLATPRSIDGVVRDKLMGAGFGGNAFTDHGREREPAIAAWVEREYGIAPSTRLFHADGMPRHLATPDGVTVRPDGALELAELKTTSKPLTGVPRNYLRQVWWQQYVLGADRTLFVWERHEDFVPVGEPQCIWIDRDDAEIAALLALANELLSRLDASVARG